MLRRLRIENLVLIREAELELSPGLVAITGETGTGKTIVTQAIGLLLGAKGETAAVGAAASEAFVEAELDVPERFFEEEGLETLRELRPEDEPRLVVARRVGSDGRARAYAWGRSRRTPCSRGRRAPPSPRAPRRPSAPPRSRR